MEIKDFLWLMWRGARYLVLGLLLGIALGLAASILQPPDYEASTKVLVNRSRQQTAVDLLPLSEDQLVTTNALMVKTKPVLDDASYELGIKIDPDTISVTVLPNTMVIQIKVQNRDAKQAAALLERGLVPEVPEVVLEGIAREGDEEVDREGGDAGGDERGRARGARDGVGDGECEERPRRALALARDGRAPLPGEDERRRHRVGEDPRERHPEAADEPELVEPAEVGGEEGRVRGARGERGGERREPGLADGDLHGGEGRDAVAALLEVAREEDEPDVDAVADDDGPEERGVRVQVADDRLGDAEGDERAGQERDADREDRLPGAVLEDVGAGLDVLQACGARVPGGGAG